MYSKLFSEFANKVTYSNRGNPTNRDPITDDEYVQIGRIIRLCAEVEDYLTLFICNLKKITQSEALAILQKKGWTSKVEIAKKEAKLNHRSAVNAFEAVFTTGLATIQKARNCVAHGIYLGRRDNGALSFLTSDEIGKVGSKVMLEVQSYDKDLLKGMADALEHNLPYMVSILQLERFLTERDTQYVLPHPKSPSRAPPQKKIERSDLSP
jgi:hypothetical protein